MKYDWYVFDLDGTLAESGEGIINSAKFALDELGVPCPVCGGNAQIHRPAPFVGL